MSYQVLRTDTADEQIRDAAQYLARSAGTHAALRFLDELEAAAGRLAEFPRIGSVPHWGTLARRGFRSLVVGNHILLYSIDDQRRRVIVEAVVYGRREWWRLV